jgi:hypothetical protein
MFKRIPAELLILIMNMFEQEELFNFLSTNKEYNILKDTYDYSHEICISRSINKYVRLFPNFKNICIRWDYIYGNDNFQLCSHITKLDIQASSHRLTTDFMLEDMFRHLTNLKELKLKRIFSTNRNQDKIFDHLSNLETLHLEVENNITDRGLQKLVNIKNLSINACHNISRCYSITGDGISNLTSLIRLNLNQISNLFDHHLQNLINLEELMLTDAPNITCECITTHLLKLKLLNVRRCENLASCANFNKLKSLQCLFIIRCSTKDSDFIHLKYIKYLCISDCSLIQGKGFKYLLNIEGLSISNILLADHYLDDIIALTNIKRLSIINTHDCGKSTSKYDTLLGDRKDQLRKKFGNKFRCLTL